MCFNINLLNFKCIYFKSNAYNMNIVTKTIFIDEVLKFLLKF